MSIVAFDHVNIRTVNLEVLVGWYEKVLSLRVGPRPEFPVPGAWLYLNGTCVLHLIEADPPPAVHAEGESVRLEHFAFRAEGMDAFLGLLRRQNIHYKLFPFDALDTVSVFIRDPDGNRMHVDFPANEAH